MGLIHPAYTLQNRDIDTVDTHFTRRKLILYGCTDDVMCQIHANRKIALTFMGIMTHKAALLTLLFSE